MCAFVITPNILPCHPSKRPRTNATIIQAQQKQNNNNNNNNVALAATAVAIALAPFSRIGLSTRSAHAVRFTGCTACVIAYGIQQKRGQGREQVIKVAPKEKEQDRNIMHDFLMDEEDEDEDEDEDEEEREEEKEETIEEIDVKNLFKTSRDEWNDDTTSTGNSNSGSNSTGSDSGTSYSYAFRRSKTKKGDNIDDENEKMRDISFSNHTSSSSFSSMRTEFENNDIPIYSSSSSSIKSKKTNGSDIQTYSRPLSSGELARRVLTLPVILVRDVVGPTTDVVSVGWHDVRLRIEDLSRREMKNEIFFEEDDESEWIDEMMRFRNGDKSGGDDAGEDNEMGVELTEEEMYVVRIGEMAAGGVRSVRLALGKLGHLFMK